MKLICRKITKEYSEKIALSNISLTLEPGSLIGLVGPNGAGKSTLMKVLATLEKPTIGDIFLDGESTLKHPNSLRRLLGYLPQKVPVYPNLSALEYLFYIAAVKGIKKSDAKKQIAQLISQFHLGEAANRSLASFSGGMRQRVGLAAVMLGDPQIIIADEPTAGLDPEERASLRNFLSELSRDRIVLLSTHIVSDIEAVAGVILLLREGQLVYNGSPDLLMHEARGQVWEYTLPQGMKPDKTAVISSLVQTSQGMQVREVSAYAPSADAKPASATLEDACLAALKAGVPS